MRHVLFCWRPLVLCCVLAAGCASAKGSGAITDEDLAEAGDLAAPADLGAGTDLRADIDLRTPVDLGPGQDLRAITGCQVVPQAGCPTGMKCTTHDSATTICDPVGTMPRGQSCTVTGEADNCAAGAVCIDEGAVLAQCRAFCRSDVDCVSANSFCEYPLGAPMVFKVCTQPCSPVYPGTGCNGGLACNAYDTERTDCREGLRGEGERCDDGVNEYPCKGGMACVNTLCRRVCTKGDSSVCAAGQSCASLQAGAYIWTKWGACCPFGIC